MATKRIHIYMQDTPRYWWLPNACACTYMQDTPIYFLFQTCNRILMAAKDMQNTPRYSLFQTCNRILMAAKDMQKKSKTETNYRKVNTKTHWTFRVFSLSWPQVDNADTFHPCICICTCFVNWPTRFAQKGEIQHWESRMREFKFLNVCLVGRVFCIALNPVF